MQALHQRRDTLMPQNQLRNLDVSVTKLSTHSYQSVRAHYICPDVQNTGSNDLLIVFFLEWDGIVSIYLHEIHRREVTTHNTGSFICKLAHLDPYRLADCHLVFSNNKKDHDGLANQTCVSLDMHL